MMLRILMLLLLTWTLIRRVRRLLHSDIAKVSLLLLLRHSHRGRRREHSRSRRHSIRLLLSRRSALNERRRHSWRRRSETSGTKRLLLLVTEMLLRLSRGRHRVLTRDDTGRERLRLLLLSGRGLIVVVLVRRRRRGGGDILLRSRFGKTRDRLLLLRRGSGRTSV